MLLVFSDFPTFEDPGVSASGVTLDGQRTIINTLRSFPDLSTDIHPIELFRIPVHAGILRIDPPATMTDDPEVVECLEADDTDLSEVPDEDQ